MQLQTKRLETQRKPTSSKTPINQNHNQTHNLNHTQYQNQIQGHPLFPFGSQVEVSSDEEGFKGAWFLATVLKPPPSSSLSSTFPPQNKLFIEYSNLLAEENGSDLLAEFVDIQFVRPRPPVDNVNEVCYKVDDVVDAYYQDGWWCGVVTEVVEPNSKYRVFFSNPPDEMLFGRSDLRIHKTWVQGNWVLPQRTQTMRNLNFNPGTAVEVTIDPEYSCDAWFPATFVKQLSDKSFLVECQSSSEAGLQKVTVDSHHIRPSPPDSSKKTFSLLEKVDAFCDRCWLSGIVTKILADGRYIVYFKRTKKEKELPHSDLRLHMDWTNGKWVPSSQDSSTTPNLNKHSGLTNGAYKEKNRSADSGVMKGNVRQDSISAVTQKGCENNSQTPSSEKASFDSTKPSNQRIKRTSSNGDNFSLRLSSRSNEEATSDAPLSPLISKPHVKQTEVSDNCIAGDIDTSTPDDQGKSSLKQSEDTSQPFDFTEMKCNYEKFPVTRRRGRPRKLRVSVAGFHADTVNRMPAAVTVHQSLAAVTVNQTPAAVTVNHTSTICDSVKPCGLVVVALTHNGKMIDSIAESSEQLLKMDFDEKEKQSGTSADHGSIESESQKEGEVTNLKRKRGRPPKALLRRGSPKPKAVSESVESAAKERQDGIDVEGSAGRSPAIVEKPSERPPVYEVEKLPDRPLVKGVEKPAERPPANEVEKPDVEPPAISDSTPSTGSHSTRVRIISDQLKRLSDVSRSATRTTARRHVRKHRKVPIAAAMEPANAFIFRGKKLKSTKQAELPSEDVGAKSRARVAGNPDNGIARNADKAVAVISSTASDDDKPLSAWLEVAHSPLAIDESKLQSDEAGERWDEKETLHCGLFKGKEARIETSAGNGSQFKDISSGQDEMATQCTALVPRENQDLPFVRNSVVWGMIESMEVLKRIPQKPHFRPLYNCKEECREGLAIGSMVTFTSLAERISKTCFDDPNSLLDGYLEALVDLEELGFNVKPLRDLLYKLLSIKGRHEHAQNTSKEIENQMMERNNERSKIDNEIADLGRTITELKEKQALEVSKRDRKDAEIKLLQSSMDAVQGALERDREEFEKAATSLW